MIESASRASSPVVERHGDRLDPDEYKNAKKNLKKAILEHYRYLELLQNYRVSLNIFDNHGVKTECYDRY